MTFGFDTAVQIATEAIDRLHTTAESHNRVMIVEVMGRHAGWIALHSGLAGGADVILIPERPFDIEEVCRLIQRRHSRGRYFSIVVVAEGAVPQEGTMELMAAGEDEFGHARLGGIGQRLEREIEERTGSSRARRCSATSSAAARRRRSTACWPPAWASRRSTRRTTGSWGDDARAARHAHRAGAAVRGGGRACGPCRSRTTRPRRPSSARSATEAGACSSGSGTSRPSIRSMNGFIIWIGGGAHDDEHREQERVERLDAEGPGDDPPDEPDRERDEDGHQAPLRRSATARRSFVTVLNAPFMARSAPEPSGGSIPIWRANEAPSK